MVYNQNFTCLNIDLRECWVDNGETAAQCEIDENFFFDLFLDFTAVFLSIEQIQRTKVTRKISKRQFSLKFKHHTDRGRKRWNVSFISFHFSSVTFIFVCLQTNNQHSTKQQYKKQRRIAGVRQ